MSFMTKTRPKGPRPTTPPPGQKENPMAEKGHVFCRWCSREMFFINYTPDGFEEYACPCGKTYRKGISDEKV